MLVAVIERIICQGGTMSSVAKMIDEAVRQQELRGSPRVSVSINVDVQENDHVQVTFSAIDISRTGAFLKCSQPGVKLPLLGSRLKLLLRWPVETPTPPVNVNARVVRLEADGFGVKFLY